MQEENGSMDKLAVRRALADSEVDGKNLLWQCDTLRIEELAQRGIIRLQGPSSDRQFCTEVEQITGLELPPPCQLNGRGDITWAWVNPNEWLLMIPLDDEDLMLERLKPCQENRLATATIISDSRVTFRVGGSEACDLLAKGCGLDFHLREFVVGNALITLFAQIPTMITRPNEASFEIIVDRSQARYLWQWLLDAAQEFAS
jgi:sarcosine oxidase subunit gamma